VKMLTISISPQLLFIFTFITLCIQTVLGDGTITITDAAAYSSLLPCAQQCVYKWDLGCPNVPDPIGNAIGCYQNLNAGCEKVSWAMDSCYCRTDLQAAAVKAIKTCVLSECTIGDSMADFSSVSMAYEGYCSGAGYTVKNAAVASTTASGGESGTALSKPGAGVASSTSSGESSTFQSSLYGLIRFLTKKCSDICAFPFIVVETVIRP
jgi:hypothetical protein